MNCASSRAPILIREFGIRETRYANYRVAVGLLIGQGWEQRRPTLPKLCVDKARPKVLAFLRLNYLLVGSEWQKQCSSSIAFTHIFVYRLDNRCRKCKKTKAFGLVLIIPSARQGSSLRLQPCPSKRPTATR